MDSNNGASRNPTTGSAIKAAAREPSARLKRARKRRRAWQCRSESAMQQISNPAGQGDGGKNQTGESDQRRRHGAEQSEGHGQSKQRGPVSGTRDALRLRSCSLGLGGRWEVLAIHSNGSTGVFSSSASWAYQRASMAMMAAT